MKTSEIRYLTWRSLEYCTLLFAFIEYTEQLLSQLIDITFVPNFPEMLSFNNQSLLLFFLLYNNICHLSVDVFALELRFDVEGGHAT